jgi:class 3 adenylate cyclase
VIGYWNANYVPSSSTAIALGFALVGINFLGMMLLLGMSILESKGVVSVKVTMLVGFWVHCVWPVSLLPMAHAALQPWSWAVNDTATSKGSGGISVLFGVVAECLTIIPLVGTVALRRVWTPRSSARGGGGGMRKEAGGRAAQLVALVLRLTDLNSRSAYMTSMAFIALASVNVVVVSPRAASIVSAVISGLALGAELYWPPSTNAGGLSLLAGASGFSLGSAVVVALHNNRGVLTAGQVEYVAFLAGLVGAGLGVLLAALRTRMVIRVWEARIKAPASGDAALLSSADPEAGRYADDDSSGRSFRNVSEMLYASSVMNNLRLGVDSSLSRSRVAPAAAATYIMDISDKSFSKAADLLVEEFKIRKATSPVPVYELLIAAAVQQYHAPISWGRSSKVVHNLDNGYPGLGAAIDLAILKRCVAKTNSSSSGGGAAFSEASGSETAVDDDLVILFEASAAFWAAVLRGEPASKLHASLSDVPALAAEVEARFQAEMATFSGELHPVLLGAYIDFCDFVKGDPILASNYRRILQQQEESNNFPAPGHHGVVVHALTPVLANRYAGGDGEGSPYQKPGAPSHISSRVSVRSAVSASEAPGAGREVREESSSTGELKSLIRASESKIPSYLLYVILGVTALALLSCFVVVLATSAASYSTNSSTKLSWNSNIVRASANIAAYALRSLEARDNPRLNGTDVFGLGSAALMPQLRGPAGKGSPPQGDPLVALLDAATRNLTDAYSKAFLESSVAKSGEIATVWLRRPTPVIYDFAGGANLQTNMTLNTYVNALIDSLNRALSKVNSGKPLNSSDVLFVVKNTILAGNPLLDTASSAVSDEIATMSLNSGSADNAAYALLGISGVIVLFAVIPMLIKFRNYNTSLVDILHTIPVNEIAKARNKSLDLAAAARARRDTVLTNLRPNTVTTPVFSSLGGGGSSNPHTPQPGQGQGPAAASASAVKVTQASAVSPLQRVVLACVVLFCAVIAVIVFVRISLKTTSHETFVGNIEIINAGQRLSHSTIQVVLMAEGTRNDSRVWTATEHAELFDEMSGNIEECAGHTLSLTFGGAGGKDASGPSVFTDASRSEFLPGFLYKKGYEHETARSTRSACDDLSKVECGSEINAFERFQSAAVAFARVHDPETEGKDWAPDVDDFVLVRDLYLQRLRPGWLESGLWFGKQPEARLQTRFSLYFSLLGYTTALCVMGWVFVLWPSLTKADEDSRMMLQILTTLPGQVLKESSEVTALVGLSVGTRGGSGGGGDKGKNQLGAKELEIFQAGLSVSEDPAFLVDLEGCVAWCSQSVGKNFGGTSMDALGKPIASFLADYRCMSFILDLHRIPSIEVAAKTAPLRLDRCSQVGREDREFRVRVVPVILNSKLYVAITAKDLDAEKEAERVKNDATSTSSLLGTLLPPSIVRRLRDGEGPIADLYPKATIIFLDLVNFTALSGGITATKLAGLLAVVFEAFDSICESMYIQRIKTIGDGYLAVGGLFDEESPYLLTVPNYTPELRAVHACCRIIHALRRINQTYNTHLAIRVGIHSGPVVAGVILPKKPAFDIFGDSVNIASRCESSGSPGQIHVTETVYLGGGVQAAGFQAEKRSVQFKGKSTESVTYLINPASAPPLPHDFVFGVATQGDSDAIQLPE